MFVRHQVAKETAGKFNPNVKLHAHHANIKDAQFNSQWYKGFDLVFNALDNLDARRHVNKMCLVAEVPLIESGTTGFNGQVQVIKKVRWFMDRLQLSELIGVGYRESLSATTVYRSLYQRASLCVPFEARLASQFIV